MLDPSPGAAAEAAKAPAGSPPAARPTAPAARPAIRARRLNDMSFMLRLHERGSFPEVVAREGELERILDPEIGARIADIVGPPAPQQLDAGQDPVGRRPEQIARGI